MSYVFTTCITCGKNLNGKEKYCSAKCRKEGEDWVAEYEAPLRAILEKGG